MSYEPLSSDFYSYGSLLTGREQEALAALRAWLERDVQPIVNDHWERAEFPMEVVKPLADLGVLSFAWDETAPFENSAVFRGFVALELARVDASVGTFVGVQNGLAIGSVATAGSAEQRREWIPRLASGEVIGYLYANDEDDAAGWVPRVGATPAQLNLASPWMRMLRDAKRRGLVPTAALDEAQVATPSNGSRVVDGSRATSASLATLVMRA